MYKILGKKLFIMLLFLGSSCTTIDSLINNKIVVNSIAGFIESQVLSLDNNGKGLMVWNGQGRIIENFLATGNSFPIGDNFGMSSMGLNTKGDGFVLSYPYAEVSVGRPTRTSQVSVYYQKIKAFKPADMFGRLPEGIPAGHVSIDEQDNGLVYWTLDKNTINYSEIKNLNISENISQYKKSNVNSVSYISDNQIKEILNTRTDETTISRDSDVIDTVLDAQGNGVYIAKKDTKHYLKIISEYKITDKKMLLESFENFPFHKAVINKQGNGFLIRSDKNGIVSNKINNFSLAADNQYIVNNSNYKSEPIISVNEIGKGYLAWFEYTTDANYAHNCTLNAKLIENYSIR